MHVDYINNETRDFLGAQQNHLCCKKLKRLRKQRIAPLTGLIYEVTLQGINYVASLSIICSYHIDTECQCTAM